MSSPGGGCAACQLLQGACGTDCLFAPHFPAGDDPARFAAVQAAFGADSVARFLSCIPQVHRAEAVHWLVVNTPWRLAVASAQQPSAAAASGGGTPPCAACRHLQITCVPGCVFAPHFPASDDPARFAAVNARFGTSHVALILCGLSPAKQAEAARSFVRQAQHPTAAAGPPAPPLERRPPCSACKHFRKKCEPDCVFWPHYPPDDDPKRFAAVHAVYGARNMARHLRDLPPELRGEAATWSAYEARRRQQHTVLGVTGDLIILETARKMVEEQLAAARKELARHIGEEAASRAFVPALEPRPHMVTRTPQEMEDSVRAVAQQVLLQAKADAAAGVIRFVTPLHEMLVKEMTPDVPRSSAGVPGSPGLAQSATGIFMQQPPPSGIQPLPEGKDAGDEPFRG